MNGLRKKFCEEFAKKEKFVDVSWLLNYLVQYLKMQLFPSPLNLKNPLKAFYKLRFNKGHMVSISNCTTLMK